MQTRDQIYASKVYGQIVKLKPKSTKATRYGSMAHSLPILIRSAGLAQALSFVEARGAKEDQEARQTPNEGGERNRGAYYQLLDDISATVIEGNVIDGNMNVLLQRARTSQLEEYILLTQHVMDALLWYKRFAQSVLGVEANDQQNDNRS